MDITDEYGDARGMGTHRKCPYKKLFHIALEDFASKNDPNALAYINAKYGRPIGSLLEYLLTTFPTKKFINYLAAMQDYPGVFPGVGPMFTPAYGLPQGFAAGMQQMSPSGMSQTGYSGTGQAGTQQMNPQGMTQAGMMYPPFPAAQPTTSSDNTAPQQTTDNSQSAPPAGADAAVIKELKATIARLLNKS